MGRRGPMPKPTAIKKLRGNPGKRALNKREPTPAPALPEAPFKLSPGALEAWDRVVPRLHDMKVLCLIDSDVLALWCETYSQWQRVQAVLRKKGQTCEVETLHGTRTMARPEVAMERALRRDLIAHGRDFGLTPSSRSNLKTNPDEAADPLQDFLDGAMGKG